MNKRTFTGNIILAVSYIIAILIVLSVIGITIYIWITYGNKPINEVPSWAAWWMLGGRK